MADVSLFGSPEWQLCHTLKTLCYADATSGTRLCERFRKDTFAYWWYSASLVAWQVSSCISCFVICRGHLLRLQRGEKHFLPLDIFKKDPPSITVSRAIRFLSQNVFQLSKGITCEGLASSLKTDSQDTDVMESLPLSTASVTNCRSEWNPSQIVMFEMGADTKDTSSRPCKVVRISFYNSVYAKNKNNIQCSYFSTFSMHCFCFWNFRWQHWNTPVFKWPIFAGVRFRTSEFPSSGIKNCKI